MKGSGKPGKIIYRLTGVLLAAALLFGISPAAGAVEIIKPETEETDALQAKQISEIFPLELAEPTEKSDLPGEKTVYSGAATLSIEPRAGEIAIASAAELAKIGVDANYPLSGNYVQTANIDLSGYAEGVWTPIGYYTSAADNAPFTGTYDGRGYKVTGLKITGAEDYRGLFGYALGATFKNINIENASVAGRSYVGLLAGWIASSGIVQNCKVNGGTVTGSSNYVGGFAGQAQGVAFTGSQNNSLTVAITGGSYAGGFVGMGTNLSFVDCESNSLELASPRNYLGGFVGQGTNTSLVRCDTNGGTVSAVTTNRSNIGGLIGNETGKLMIDQCYNTAAIKGGTQVGGLVGNAALGNGTVTNSYNRGVINISATGATTTMFGGLVGQIVRNTSYTFEVSGCYSSEFVYGGRAIGYLSNVSQLSGSNNYYTERTQCSVPLQAAAPAGFAEKVTDAALWRTLPSDAYRLRSGGAEAPVLKDNPEPNADQRTYEVKTAEDLYKVRNDLQGNYVQTADIDLSAYAEWETIGYFTSTSDYAPFTGTYDGGGYRITGLKMTGTKDYRGLFGYSIGATFRHMRIEGADVAGATYVSALAAYAIDGTFEDCKAEEGTFLATGNYLGGLTGYLLRGTYADCESSGNTFEGSTYIGGLVGYGMDVSMERCDTNGGILQGRSTRTGGTTGGLVGGVVGVTRLIKCYNTAEVNVGAASAGGLIGYLQGTDAAITDSYSRGAVTGPSYAGGLVGRLTMDAAASPAVFTGCYASGAVTGATGAIANNTNGAVTGSGNYYTVKTERTLALSKDEPSGFATKVEDTFMWVTLPSNSYQKIIAGYPILIDNPEPGTEQKTYEVWTAEDLFNARNDMRGNYIQMQDIDLSGYDNWTPIGYYTSAADNAPFTGTYDGRGYKITGLKVTGTGNYRGLFGYALGATFKNINIENASVTGTNYVGVLAGWITSSGIVQNCKVNGGTVAGAQYIGGFAGQAQGVAFTGSQNNSLTVTASSSSAFAGGFAGIGTDLSFEDCESNSLELASPRNYLGGFVGQGTNTSLVRCDTNGGTVSAVTTYRSCIGGLIGNETGKLTIDQCYNTAAIKGGTLVGGLVGNAALGDGTVTNSYNRGVINISGMSSGTSPTYLFGGLVGQIVRNTSYTFEVSGCYSSEFVYGGRAIGYLSNVSQLSGSNNYYTERTQCSIPLQAAAPAGFVEKVTDATLWRTLPSGVYRLRSGGAEAPVLKDNPEPNADQRTYEVKTAEDLYKVRNDLQGNYVQTADIDLSAYAEWETIGYFTSTSDYAPFTGTYDGGGYRITGLKMTGTKDYRGLFGYSIGATFRHMRIEGADVAGATYVSALAAYAIDGTFEDCKAEEGTFLATGNYLGGLTGYLLRGTYADCESSGNTFEGSTYIGGLVGYGMDVSMERCDTNGGILQGRSTRTGGTTGGLVGGVVGVTRLIKCYNTAEVNVGAASAGGLIGYLQGTDAAITDSYSRGAVTGPSYAGGLVGRLTMDAAASPAVFTGCYASGAVTGATGAIANNTNGAVTGSGNYYTVKTERTLALSKDEPSGFATKVNDMDMFEICPSNSYQLLPGEYPILGENPEPTAPATEVRTAEELYNVRNNLKGNYIQTADIDLSGYANWDPITEFTGVYNGNGYKITGLKITGTSGNRGLFGNTKGAFLRNIRIEGANIAGKNYLGALASNANATIIINCEANQCTLSGTNYVGGLVGQTNSETSFTNCDVNGGTVSATTNQAGGITGQMQGNVTIDGCYVTANISAASFPGGIVGYMSSGTGTIITSYSRGSVTGTTGGGIVGSLNAGTLSINACYVTGNISSGTAVIGNGSASGGSNYYTDSTGASGAGNVAATKLSNSQMMATLPSGDYVLAAGNYPNIRSNPENLKDETPPVVANITVSNAGMFAKTKSVSATVTDDMTGVSTVFWAETADAESGTALAKDGDQWSSLTPFEKEGTYYIIAYDVAKNRSVASFVIDKLDNTAPTISNITVQTTGKQRKVTFDVRDLQPDLTEGSGVAKAWYSTSPIAGEGTWQQAAKEAEGKYSFYIPEYSEEDYYIRAEDFLGNATAPALAYDNTGLLDVSLPMKYMFVVIPNLTVSLDGQKFFTQNFTVTNNSSLADVQVSLNGLAEDGVYQAIKLKEEAAKLTRNDIVLYIKPAESSPGAFSSMRKTTLQTGMGPFALGTLKALGQSGYNSGTFTFDAKMYDYQESEADVSRRARFDMVFKFDAQTG